MSTESAAPATDQRLIRLHPSDNVLVLTANIAAGDTFNVAGRSVVMPDALVLGHKIAAGDIAAGEKILKYGAPIGSAKRDIAVGENVHTHNLKSDYIPTYTLHDGDKYLEGAGGQTSAASAAASIKASDKKS